MNGGKGVVVRVQVCREGVEDQGITPGGPGDGGAGRRLSNWSCCGSLRLLPQALRYSLLGPTRSLDTRGL